MVTNEAGTYTCVIVHLRVSQNVKADGRQSLGLGSNEEGIGSGLGTPKPANRL